MAQQPNRKLLYKTAPHVGPRIRGGAGIYSRPRLWEAVFAIQHREHGRVGNISYGPIEWGISGLN